MKPFKKHRYYYEFFTTFINQIELLPRLTLRYEKFKINFIAIEWLWFGFYLQRF